MAALARPPFRGVEAVSREALLDEAHDDPLGHGTLIALDAAAAVALVLAALGLALTVLSDLRDDRGDLYDLEARVPRRRSCAASCACAPSSSGSRACRGRRGGGVLALLVTRVVAATARAAPSSCRSRPRSTSACSRSARCVYLLVAAALVMLATRRSFRGDRGPVRAQELET